MANENGNLVNYEKEVDEKAEVGQTFKPKAGTYKIVFVGEGENTVFVDKKVNPPKDMPQVKFPVSVNGQLYSWYVSKGKTGRSLFMQLMTLGKAWKGLNGKTITLIVKSGQNKDGQPQNDYTVVEASTLPQD